jgi:hypothetical protein
VKVARIYLRVSTDEQDLTRQNAIVESAKVTGQWAADKVENAGTINLGIYNIHSSALADKKQTHDGVIVHADADNVYQ